MTNTTISSGNTLRMPAATPMPQPTRAILWATETLLLWMARIRDRRSLEGMSDHLLKDIGLSRSVVDFEARKLPWQE